MEIEVVVKSLKMQIKLSELKTSTRVNLYVRDIATTLNYVKNLQQQLSAANTRIAEIDKQQPVAKVGAKCVEPLTGLIYNSYLYAKPFPSQEMKARISEQDAREILLSMHTMSNGNEVGFRKHFDSWFIMHGRALLAKLNGEN